MFHFVNFDLLLSFENYFTLAYTHINSGLLKLFCLATHLEKFFPCDPLDG